ncbi:hypothetical protein TNCV_3898111 [Trichonephila clavipes]|nr:hypothetical protein TNCV_3898111 [Trichonephila clavipes]
MNYYLRTSKLVSRNLVVWLQRNPLCRSSSFGHKIFTKWRTVMCVAIVRKGNSRRSRAIDQIPDGIVFIIFSRNDEDEAFSEIACASADKHHTTGRKNNNRYQIKFKLSKHHSVIAIVCRCIY